MKCGKVKLLIWLTMRFSVYRVLPSSDWGVMRSAEYLYFMVHGRVCNPARVKSPPVVKVFFSHCSYRIDTLSQARFVVCRWNWKWYSFKEFPERCAHYFHFMSEWWLPAGKCDANLLQQQPLPCYVVDESMVINAIEMMWCDGLVAAVLIGKSWVLKFVWLMQNLS